MSGGLLALAGVLPARCLILASGVVPLRWVSSSKPLTPNKHQNAPAVVAIVQVPERPRKFPWSYCGQRRDPCMQAVIAEVCPRSWVCATVGVAWCISLKP